MTTDPTEDPSERVATFVADLSYADLNEDLIRLAERSILDTVGVTIAGTETPAADHAAALTRAESDGGDATLVGADERVPATGAAFANGTAAHALDFDDVSWGMDGHPSAPIVVPILAAAQSTDITGSQAVTAYVAGFETECYVAAPISPDHYERGWHATATFGTFGAAAATAKVLDLDAERTRHALNVAASMAAGLKRNFGSMTKPMHVGQAARSGLTAARLANRGFTADAVAIGGERGFLDLYGTPDREAFPELGTRWALLDDGVHVKKYPCCYYTHTTIAATADIAREHGLSPEDVESIHVSLSRGGDDALAHDAPETALQAKFSLPYTAAYAVVHHGVDIAAFDEDRLDDPTVRALMESVSYDVDDDLAYSDHTATVRLRTTDGDVVRRTLEDPPGTHENPLSDAELHEKFEMCATRVVDEDRAARVLDRLDGLREAPSVADLAASL